MRQTRRKNQNEYKGIKMSTQFYMGDTVILSRNYLDEGMGFNAGTTGKVAGKDNILVRVRMSRSYEICVRPTFLKVVNKN